VTDPEPLPADHPLWRCPNVLISPHVAGRDRRQPEQLARLIENNLSRFLAGQPLLFEAA
jgi:phosphoglycerate dehydrogenase-like enzyme